MKVVLSVISLIFCSVSGGAYAVPAQSIICTIENLGCRKDSVNASTYVTHGYVEVSTNIQQVRKFEYACRYRNGYRLEADSYSFSTAHVKAIQLANDLNLADVCHAVVDHIE